jgi:DNA-binding NarL/FixJ family response regulator
MTQREIAERLGASNDVINYCLKALLIKVGLRCRTIVNLKISLAIFIY